MDAMYSINQPFATSLRLTHVGNRHTDLTRTIGDGLQLQARWQLLLHLGQRTQSRLHRAPKPRITLTILAGDLVVNAYRTRSGVSYNWHGGWQPFGRFCKASARDARCQGVGARALVDDGGTDSAGIVHDGAQATRQIGRTGAGGLDLHGVQVSTTFQQQVNLGPARRSPKVGNAMRVSHGLATQQVFQDKSFPTRAPDGVAVQHGERVNVEQVVQQPSVAQVEFWGLHQPFAYVAKVRRQTAQQKALLQNINVAHHGGLRQPLGGGKLAEIGQSALRVGQHGEQFAHQNWIGADTQGG